MKTHDQDLAAVIDEAMREYENLQPQREKLLPLLVHTKSDLLYFAGMEDGMIAYDAETATRWEYIEDLGGWVEVWQDAI